MSRSNVIVTWETNKNFIRIQMWRNYQSEKRRTEIAVVILIQILLIMKVLQLRDLSEKKFRDVIHKVLAYITLLLTFPSF